MKGVLNIVALKRIAIHVTNEQFDFYEALAVEKGITKKIMYLMALEEYMLSQKKIKGQKESDVM